MLLIAQNVKEVAYPNILNYNTFRLLSLVDNDDQLHIYKITKKEVSSFFLCLH